MLLYVVLFPCDDFAQLKTVYSELQLCTCMHIYNTYILAVHIMLIISMYV